MNSVTRKIILLSAAIVVCGCADKETVSAESIPVDVYGKENIGTFFTGWYPVFLESTDDSMIGNIDLVRIDGDRIYILDKSAYAVFIFTSEGEYVNRIAKRGRGPGEYVDISDIQARDGKLWLLDRGGKAITVYDESGAWIRVFPLNDWYNDFLILDDSRMALYSENSNNAKNNFVIYDYVADSYVGGFDPFRDNVSYGYGRSPFSCATSKRVFTTKQFDDTVYELTAESYEPVVRFEFNSKFKLPGDYENIPPEELREMIEGQSMIRRIVYVEEADGPNGSDAASGRLFAVFSGMFENKGIRNVVAMVDPATGEAVSLLMGEEAYPEFPFVNGEIVCVSEMKMVTTYPAFVVKDIAANVRAELPGLETIDEHSNPVLFFHRIGL